MDETNMDALLFLKRIFRNATSRVKGFSPKGVTDGANMEAPIFFSHISKTTLKSHYLLHTPVVIFVCQLLVYVIHGQLRIAVIATTV